MYTVTELINVICCRAKEKQTGKIYALKKIKMERETEGFPLTSIREINILLALHHKNIVNVTEVRFPACQCGPVITSCTPCKQTCHICRYTLQAVFVRVSFQT